MIKNPFSTAWGWVPSLYFTEAFPMIFITSVSTLFFMEIGMSIDSNTFWGSLMVSPWILKGIWSPLLEQYFTRRQWIFLTQLLMSALFVCVGFFAGTDCFYLVLIGMFCIACVSSTHDIAADGFYIDALDNHRQAFYSGIRNTFYRLGNITMQAGLVAFIDYLRRFDMISSRMSWQIGIFAIAVLMIIMALYHRLILPNPPSNLPSKSESHSIPFIDAFRTFFKLPNIVSGLAFILLYRFAEAQLEKVGQIFLVSDVSMGGLGLSLNAYSFIKGSVGVGSLLLGGLLGGLIVARFGLKKWLWPMVLAMNVPNVLYYILAYFQITDLNVITTCVAIEQFGYGFGFTAFMLFMLSMVEKSSYRAAHYAILTAFMALGMMLPGMMSGKLQLYLGGYPNFFLWVLLCTIPSFITAYYIKFPDDFGLKKRT